MCESCKENEQGSGSKEAVGGPESQRFVATRQPQTGEDFVRSVRENNIFGRNKTRLELWEEHLTDPVVVLGQAMVRGSSVVKLIVVSRIFQNRGAAIYGMEVSGLVPEFWCKEKVWTFLDAWDSVHSRTVSL